ncbi:MAG TPA: YdcF family protein [Nitrospira sp.]|nr:YdcF family protein [Nitrospira sp.]
MEPSPFLFGLYKLVKYGLYPLNWVLLLMALTTLLLCLPSHPGRLRLARIGAVGSLILLLLISNPVIAGQLLGSLEARYPMPPPPGGQHHDAIVVLGGGVLDRGTLRPTVELTSYSRNRTTCGVDLYQQGYAERLVLTGGNGLVFATSPKDAAEMKRWALRLGVPEQAILTEEDSRTTYENAVGTKRLLGPASILLVSSASHLPRATAIFSKQGFQVTPAPCDFMIQDRPQDSWNRIDPFDLFPSDLAIQKTQGAVTELAGMAIYWITGKL